MLFVKHNGRPGRRPIDVPAMKACVAELRAIAERYRVVNDQAAEIYRKVLHEVCEADLRSPDGKRLEEFARALCTFQRAGVAGLTTAIVLMDDFAGGSLAPAVGASPCQSVFSEEPSHA
jgi:hypothetical protein